MSFVADSSWPWLLQLRDQRKVIRRLEDFIRRKHLTPRHAADARLRHEQVVQACVRPPQVGNVFPTRSGCRWRKPSTYPASSTVWIVRQRIRPPLSQTSARSRCGSFRTSSSSPGASVLKSPTSACGPGCCRAMAASSARSSNTRRRSVQAACTALKVHAVHPPVGAFGHDLQERVAGDPRLLPCDMRNRPAAHEAERLSSPRTPLRHARSIGQPFDDRRLRRFLKHHQIGRRLADDVAERGLAAGAAE